MKRFWILILLTVLYPTAGVRAAEGICACYSMDEVGVETCEYFLEDEDSDPFTDQDICILYCRDTFEDFTRHDWADETGSSGAIDLQENCVGTVAEAQASSPASSSSTTTTTTSRPLLTPILSIDIPTVTFSTGTIKDGVLNVNYLGDYISGIYKYLLGISTTIAIIMLMIGGLEWAISGGSILGSEGKSSASRAQTRIKNAVTGLVLLLGTYLILFTVNPNLIKLQFPELKIIKVEPLEAQTPGPTGTANRLCETIDDCNDFCKNPNLVPAKTAGMADPSQTEELTQQQGLYISGTESLLPDTKQKLEAAARIATAKGYSIVVVDAYRPLKEQLKFVCDEITLAGIQKRTPNIPSAIAWPGGSSHGTGTAVDVRLGNTSGTSLWSVGFNSQKNAKLEHVKMLAEIMYEAGFQRYHKEIWHFQTNTGTCTSNQCFGYFGDAGCSC